MRRRRGFTLVELLITLAMVGVLAAAAQRLLSEQRRFSTWTSDTADTHDARRILWTLLSADVEDAVATAGDLALPGADSLAVRTFVGLGYACAVSTNPGLLAVAWSDGAGWTPGDSLMVYASNGWRALAPVAELPALPVRCGTFGVNADHIYGLLDIVGDAIPVGAPVRVFRWRTYHVAASASKRWIARSDRMSTEMLVGPLAGDGLQFQFVNAAGGATDVASAMALRVVATLDRSPVPYSWSSGRDTVRLLLRLRNQ